MEADMKNEIKDSVEVMDGKIVCPDCKTELCRLSSILKMMDCARYICNRCKISYLYYGRCGRLKKEIPSI
jgi:transposase-like protein